MTKQMFVLVAVSLLGACRPRSGEGSASPAASPAVSVTPAGQRPQVGTRPGGVGAGTPLAPAPGHALAAFALGCFWGSENTFRHVPGVTATAVGYAGGHTERPTYEDVCSHTTGHAETVLVEFDPKKVSYTQLLEVFFDTHDPTTLNRQGPDVGDQYRSAIFFFSDAQRSEAEKARADEERRLGKPVTTQLSAIPTFWIAEDYHQQYDEKTGRESCPLPRARTAKAAASVDLR